MIMLQHLAPRALRELSAVFNSCEVELAEAGAPGRAFIPTVKQARLTNHRAPFSKIEKAAMHFLFLTLLSFLVVGVERATAFTCMLSPDKSTVIVKVSNPYPRPAACTGTCNFIAL